MAIDCTSITSRGCIMPITNMTKRQLRKLYVQVVDTRAREAIEAELRSRA